MSVIDKTGLGAKYDSTLEWVPDAAEDATCPALFAVLQEQLGAKLETAKGPVDMGIIDHINRPSEN